MAGGREQFEKNKQTEKHYGIACDVSGALCDGLCVDGCGRSDNLKIMNRSEAKQITKKIKKKRGETLEADRHG